MTETSRPEHQWAEAAGTARKRSNLFGLLAGVFRAPATPELIASLRHEELREALTDAGVAIDNDLDQAREADVLHTLAVDYTQLFHGPRNQIHPYESTHVGREDDRQLMGDATMQVREALAEAGFSVRDDSTVLPDHIGVELEFMAELTRREGDAWDRSDREDADVALRMQRRFLESHLGVWGPGFAERVSNKAETAFYREFASLLGGFLEAEKASLDNRIEDDQGRGRTPEASFARRA